MKKINQKTRKIFQPKKKKKIEYNLFLMISNFFFFTKKTMSLRENKNGFNIEFNGINIKNMIVYLSLFISTLTILERIANRTKIIHERNDVIKN